VLEAVLSAPVYVAVLVDTDAPNLGILYAAGVADRSAGGAGRYIRIASTAGCKKHLVV
jgi:hypothetical protein